MERHILLPSILLLLAACTDRGADTGVNTAATAAGHAGITWECLYAGDERTWVQLALTDQQVQGVLGLRNRMSETGDKTGDATDMHPGTGQDHTGLETEKDGGAGHGGFTTEENARNTSTSPTGRSGAMYTEQSMRELREILTPRQLEQWGELCQQQPR